LLSELLSVLLQHPEEVGFIAVQQVCRASIHHRGRLIVALTEIVEHKCHHDDLAISLDCTVQCSAKDPPSSYQHAEGLFDSHTQLTLVEIVAIFKFAQPRLPAPHEWSQDFRGEWVSSISDNVEIARQLVSPWFDGRTTLPSKSIWLTARPVRFTVREDVFSRACRLHIDAHAFLVPTVEEKWV